jgi:hypothetical protein
MRKFFLAVLIAALSISVLAFGAESSRPNIASWSTTGKDLYEKCSSANGTVAHACGEYLLGFLTGVVMATPANAQIFCPPANLSFFRLETAYIKWAKANPELLGRTLSMAAAGALSDAFPCSK